MLVCLGLEWKGQHVGVAHVSVQHMLITATNILNVVTTISTLLLYMDLVRMTCWKLNILCIHAAETVCYYKQQYKRHMSWHDLVSSQASNVCITRHAPLNAIAYIVYVKQFVMSLPTLSLGDWFSVTERVGQGFPHARTTHVRMNQRTYTSSTMSQHCWNKNPCKALPRDGMSKVTYNSHTYNRLVRYKFSMATPSLVPRPEKGRRKGPGFHCLRMRLIIRNRNTYS